jgi:sulfur carrier protein ThiS
MTVHALKQELSRFKGTMKVSVRLKTQEAKVSDESTVAEMLDDLTDPTNEYVDFAVDALVVDPKNNRCVIYIV